MTRGQSINVALPLAVGAMRKRVEGFGAQVSRIEPISVTVPAAVDAMRKRVEGEPLAKAKAKPRFLDSAGNEMKRPVVQGFACLHDKAFFASGRIRWMKVGAFIDSIHDSTTKRVLFDHDPSQEVGSTSTGLEFANCLTGLAFRMPLDDSPNARKIYEAVTQNARSCVSIGATVVDSERRKIADGTEYDYITRVSLEEISLCREGAVERTFAEIVDLGDNDESLWMACRSSTFAFHQAVANATSRGQRVIDGLQVLKDSLRDGALADTGQSLSVLK